MKFKFGDKVTLKRTIDDHGIKNRYVTKGIFLRYRGKYLLCADRSSEMIFSTKEVIGGWGK